MNVEFNKNNNKNFFNNTNRYNQDQIKYWPYKIKNNNNKPI